MNNSVISKLSGLLESEDFMKDLAEEIVAAGSDDEHSTGGSDEQDKEVDDYGREGSQVDEEDGD